MRVVFDIHVFVHNMLNDESTWPEVSPLPPKTGSAAADCISLAFDALEVRLYISPHIIRNTVRILRDTEHSDSVIDAYIEALVDIVDISGGAVVDPLPLDHGVRDHEDNRILDLVLAVDADILVSDDNDLTSLSPWNGRPILRPYEFVNRVLQSRRIRG
jgi:predicted nucleic acid-binding protein